MMQNRKGATDALATAATHRTSGGSMHHELCSLVQVVSGYLEMLATRTEDALSLRYIETAQTAAYEIAKLTESIAPEARK